jgi:hypothetical protein
LALVVAVTLFREGVPTGFRLGGIAHWSSDGLRLLSRDPLGSSQFVLNIVLFVPAGVAWTWILKRPLVVLLALGGVSLVIESIQAVTDAGAPDAADLVANSIGAGIGVAVAAIVNTVSATHDRRMTLRSQLLVAAALVVVLLVAISGWFVGASRRQQRVEDALRAAFEGTDRSSIEAMLESAPEQVFGATTDFADGTRYSDDALEIRYPATFFSLHRCVYVVWNSTGVEFRKASGRDCTDFIDG